MDTDIALPINLAGDTDSSDELETGDNDEYSGESEISEDDESSLEEIFENFMHRINQSKLPQGSAERMQFVLTELGNKNLWSKVEDQKTAFHCAVVYKNSEVVQLLIHKARLSLSSSSFSSSASNAHDQSISLESLLRQADLLGYTALHRAVENGDMEIAKLLAEADPSDKHIENFRGETPIYTAVRLEKIGIVNMIGATCTVPAFDGPDGKTALHAAITNLPEGHTGSSDMVKEVLEAGKRQFSTSIQSHSFIDFIRKADDSGKTALDLAVLRNDLGVVKQIFEADPSCALYTATTQGYKDIIREICKQGGSASAHALGPRKHTALHAAILSGDKDCVEMVLNSGIYTALERDGVGLTALHHAADKKFDSVIGMLINFTDDSKLKKLLSESDEFWEKVPTPLWLATDGGYTSTVIILMKFLPYLCGEVHHEKHRNVLHLAAHHSHKEMVQTMVKHCPSEYLNDILNGKDDDGNTPLHLLVEKGCFVKELVKHKEIDRTARNNRKWTPFDMLYVEDKIIADQLQIKIALDDTTAHQHLHIWHRGNNLKSITQESLVPPRAKSKKDGAFKLARGQLMNKEVERYRRRTKTQIIVTALITTVTFTVGFTVPGGYYQSGQLNQGMVLLSKNSMFTAFMVLDAIALALSTTSLLLYFISSIYEDPREVSILNLASAVLNIFSIIAMMATFITGTYAVLSHSLNLAISVCIICSIFFVSIIVLLIKMLCDRDKLEEILV